MNNLRELRIQKLMSQKELSNKSGVSQVTISFIENGLTIPMDLTRRKLAKALRIKPDELFPEEEKKMRALQTSK